MTRVRFRWSFAHCDVCGGPACAKECPGDDTDCRVVTCEVDVDVSAAADVEGEVRLGTWSCDVDDVRGWLRADLEDAVMRALRRSMEAA